MKNGKREAVRSLYPGAGIFEIRAADTLQPIIDWVKSKNWELSGLEELTIDPSSILVAMRSHLNYCTYELQPAFQISEKGYKSEYSLLKATSGCISPSNLKSTFLFFNISTASLMCFVLLVNG